MLSTRISYKVKASQKQYLRAQRLLLPMLISFMCLFALHSATVTAQVFQDFNELDAMPMPVANNAVCGYGDNLYSFGGIDSSLIFSGITRASFRYDLSASNWSTLADLPDSTGKIASWCSRVKDKIYVLGGYHVLASGNEISSDRVHIFDPLTNSFEADGAAIPVAIDDQVQGVWRDSLIYLISGWSNTTNVADVQIYDPANDSWQVGTAVPNTSNYKVFGGSGLIYGDTIYYIGGARFGSSFPLGMVFRKGAIDPADPTTIVWSDQMLPEALGYRMASAIVSNFSGINIAWIGGSTTSYNYNAIAYNGSGLVEPEDRAVIYNNGVLTIETAALPSIMDLRGSYYYDTPESAVFLAGGIGPSGQVSDKTYKINAITLGVPDFDAGRLKLQPNFGSGPFLLQVPENLIGANLQLFDTGGRLLMDQSLNSTEVTLRGETYPSGNYYLVVKKAEVTYQTKLVLTD